MRGLPGGEAASENTGGRARLGAGVLDRDVLALDAGPLAQGQHDRADHRHQQD
jgi:hypothetical protein